MPSELSDANAIRVEGLGKQYQLGEREPYKTLRGSVSRLVKKDPSSPGQRERGRTPFWALRNASFNAAQGEVIGIIGANGAGKSTLLKLLSRVTAPTEGRAVLHGRVSALLEVGTGFHPELTGRENVFLNGSILGMRQAAIRSKFDEIVEFSEIGQFIDTPIKRYSSGMQVRLAFAVAAYLEPEILIVDEVLAVGDVAFQRKCLGQLGLSSREGRTVLFVSHNLPAIRTLCPRSLVLSHGSVVFDGATEEAIDEYLATSVGVARDWDLVVAERPPLEMRHGVELIHASVMEPAESDAIPVGDCLKICVEFRVDRPTEEAIVVLNVSTTEDVLVAQSVSTSSRAPFELTEPATYSVTLSMESAQLQPGRYYVGFGIRSSLGLEDHANRVGMIEFVESEHAEFPWFTSTNGFLRLPVDWSGISKTDEASGGTQ